MAKRRGRPGSSPDVPPDLFPTPDPLGTKGDEEPRTATVPALAPLEQAAAPPVPERVHLVVVTTEPSAARMESGPTAEEQPLHTRYWHPREGRWKEQGFASLEHALHLFVNEHGWVLRQQQALDGPDRHELIFEARRELFTRSAGAELLEEEVGLSPKDVAEMVERVDEQISHDDNGSHP